MSSVYPQDGVPPAAPDRKLKRRTEPTSKFFRTVRLYLEDLEEIQDAFRDISGDSEPVRITADEYDVPDVQQLPQLDQDVLTKMEFRVFSPSIWLELNPQRVWLWRFDNDRKAVYAFDRVSAVLERCRPPLWWRLLHSSLPAIVVVSLLSGRLGGRIIAVYDGPYVIAATLVGVLVIGWVAGRLPYWRGFVRQAWIIPKYRRDVRSLRKRLAAVDLPVEVVKAVAVAVVTAVVGWVLIKLGVVTP